MATTTNAAAALGDVTRFAEMRKRLLFLLGALVVYRIGRRFYSDEGGLYAALALATGFGPFIYTRFMIPEMLVALWLAIGFDLFLASLEQTSLEDNERGKQPSLLVCWGLAATMALNVLTKGLIGLVFPIGTIFLYLLLTKNLRHLLRLRLLSSFLIFLAIAAPWHVLAVRLTDRVGKGIRAAPRDALIANSVPSALRVRASRYSCNRRKSTRSSKSTCVWPGACSGRFHW